MKFSEDGDVGILLSIFPPRLSLIDAQTTEIYYQLDTNDNTHTHTQTNAHTHTQRLKLILFPKIGFGQL